MSAHSSFPSPGLSCVVIFLCGLLELCLDVRGSRSLLSCLMVLFQRRPSLALSLNSLPLWVASSPSWPPEALPHSHLPLPLLPHSQLVTAVLCAFSHLAGDLPSPPHAPICFQFLPHMDGQWHSSLHLSPLLCHWFLMACRLRSHCPVMAFEPFYCHHPFGRCAVAKPGPSRSLAFSKYEP